MHRRISLLCLLLLSQAIFAQAPMTPTEEFLFWKALDVQLTSDTTTSPGTWQYSWIGSPSGYYIAQMSTDLVNWTTLTGYGARGSVNRVGVNVSMENTPNVFFRIAVIDPIGPVPASMDTDGNGLPDAWEMYYFGHLGSDPNAAANGIPMVISFRLGVNPSSAPNDSTNTTQLVIHNPQ